MRRFALIALRAVLGAVFVYAAYTKLRQPWLVFALSIDSYQLLPEWAALTIARTLPWCELGLGLLLFSGLWLRYAAPAAASLLTIFFAVMIASYTRGLGIDCGCFGMGEALSAATLIRDGVLLAIAISLAVLSLRAAKATHLLTK